MAEWRGLSVEPSEAPPWAPLAHGFQQPNPSGVRTGRWTRSWRHVAAIVEEMAFTGGFEVDRSFANDRLVVILDEAGERIHGREARRAMSWAPDRPHRLYYVPAGAPFWTSAERPLSIRFLSVQFSRGHLRAMAQSAAALSGDPRLAFFDPRLLALARLFEAECCAETPSDPLLGDSLALGLFALLAKGGAELAPEPYRGGLTPRQVRLVCDHLERHLAEPADLAQLAGLAGLSPSHFHRAFRRSMGAPPHRWLTWKRIRRAQALMRDRGRSLADIAVETGFADQPHFTRVFSKVVGVSPGAWRRATL